MTASVEGDGENGGGKERCSHGLHEGEERSRTQTRSLCVMVTAGVGAASRVW